MWLAQSVSGTRLDAAGAISCATGAILVEVFDWRKCPVFEKIPWDFFSSDFWLIPGRMDQCFECGL
jgi:hypothetical protein